MPLQATSGAASYDAFGGGVAAVPNYIEDVFSTYLYTGNSSTQTITNGIDLSTKGGMIWMKDRTTTESPTLVDSARGISGSYYKGIFSSNTDGDGNSDVKTFNTNGFTLGYNAGTSNASGHAIVSWTFRKQPKFFDVVTYTGNSSTNVISHSLGSTPACIIVKQTSSSGNDWWVYHKDLPSPKNSRLKLNAIDASYNMGYQIWDTSSTTFTVFGSNGDSNQNGTSYVAYLFASNAGGFGLTGTDNVITCGSYTGNGSATGPTVTLGYEPQWLMIKNTTGTGSWSMLDNMRGMVVGGADPLLVANAITSEDPNSNQISPTATGFQIVSTSAEVNTNTSTYIYIAIRRGPMKVPTSGTSVFSPVARAGTGVAETVTGGHTDDAVFIKNRGSAVISLFSSRLTSNGLLTTSSTDAELTAGTGTLPSNPWDVMNGVKIGPTSTVTNASGNTFINYLFRRSPSFFDVVCFTGNGSSDRLISHNLGVTPTFIIVKNRSTASTYWSVYHVGAADPLVLNTTAAANFSPNANNGYVGFGGTNSTVFQVSGGGGSPPLRAVNESPLTYVAYLFATCAGVSKVGSYTGTGTTLQVDCGFTGGARFVLIKRTDSTGDWYVWDSARGIVAGNDPYLLLNSTAAEVTTTDYIDTYSAGFEISSTAPAAINASGGTFIFLAIA